MPALKQQNDDAFLDRFMALERRVRELEVGRRRPSPGCKMIENTPQQFTAGIQTKVEIILANDTCYSTEGMADEDDHTITLPSDGVWLQTIFIPCFSGADQVAAAYIFANGVQQGDDRKWQFRASETSGARTFSAVTPMQAGTVLDLRLYFVTHNTGAVSASDRTIAFSVDRLHDIPSY